MESLNKFSIPFLSLILYYIVNFSSAQTILSADGNSENTYNLISKVLANGKDAYEVPDCAHKSFGPHIRQQKDAELNRSVFAFYAHVTPDNDGCTKFDRQRTEIKTFNPSPDYLKGKRKETVNFSWNFKLDSGFKPSSAFCHIHQIKAGDGEDDAHPIITLTPRKKGNLKILQIIHIDSKGKSNVVKSTDLTPFLGQWIHVNEKITYDTKGKYSVTLTGLQNNKNLFSYSSDNIDMWRSGTTFVRPKWGIYRSLDDKPSLRDEVVLFDTFCLAKGNDKCN